MAENRRIFYVDESAFYLLPQPGQTWAPAGQTPILRDGGRYTHLSVMSAISSQGHLYYQLQRTSYTGSEIAKFIRDLCQLNPQPLLIIWDAAKIHRSQEVTDWLRTDNHDGRVQLAILPASSPQRNATEPVWSWLKGGQLTNVCCKTLDTFPQVVQTAFEKLTTATEIIQNCFEPPEVAYY